MQYTYVPYVSAMIARASLLTHAYFLISVPQLLWGVHAIAPNFLCWDVMHYQWCDVLVCFTPDDFLYCATPSGYRAGDVFTYQHIYTT